MSEIIIDLLCDLNASVMCVCKCVVCLAYCDKICSFIWMKSCDVRSCHDNRCQIIHLPSRFIYSTSIFCFCFSFHFSYVHNTICHDEACAVRLIVIKNGQSASNQLLSSCLYVLFLLLLLLFNQTINACISRINPTWSKVFSCFMSRLCAHKIPFCPLQSTKNVIKHLHISPFSIKDVQHQARPNQTIQHNRYRYANKCFLYTFWQMETTLKIVRAHPVMNAHRIWTGPTN